MSDIHSDIPYWVLMFERDPNWSRLQMAICRRDVIMGRDEIMKLPEENKNDKPE